MTRDELIKKYPRPTEPIDDKVRQLVMADLKYRLSLGSLDEAWVPAIELLGELNHIEQQSYVIDCEERKQYERRRRT